MSACRQDTDLRISYIEFCQQEAIRFRKLATQLYRESLAAEAYAKSCDAAAERLWKNA